MSDHGSIGRCQRCGTRFALVDGKEHEHGHYIETYECERGHEGTYEYDHGAESYSGACKA